MESLSLFNTVLMLVLTIVGVLAYRRERSKLLAEHSREAAEIETRIISALKIELETLRGRIKSLEVENGLLTDTFSAVKLLLKQRGIVLIITGETVTIEEDGTHPSVPRKRSLSAPIKKLKIEASSPDEKG